MSLLTLRGVDVAYGDLPALRGIDLVIEPGEILSVVGANGAGKTTMLRAISGLLRPRAGEIVLDGARLDRLPCHAVVEQGVVQVPEGRKIFASLTVLENLELGSYTRAARVHRHESLERGRERNTRQALAGRGYVLENGRVVLSGAGRDLLDNEHVQRAYLGM